MTCLSACLYVHIWKPRFPVDWRFLVEEHIANIGINLDFLGFCRFNDFLQSGGFSRGKGCGCGCWR